MIIKNANVFSENGMFIKKDIYIKKDLFTDQRTNDNNIIDATGYYAIPGLTDLHFHGCVGYDFCDGTHEAIRNMAEYEASNGITSIVPATMTLDDNKLLRILSCASTYESKSGADLVGIYMEGPYISLAKKGAQNAKYIKKPEINHFRRMMNTSGNLIKIVALAPEENGSLEFIDTLKDEVIISIAHTTADYMTAADVLQHGVTHVTHLYNAMPEFTHRAPGVIGAAFDDKKCYVELICDGIHIDPSVIRAAFQMFGDDRIILISDSMMAAGMEDGDYSLGGQTVSVKGNRAILSDGTIAGSVTNLMQCMQNVVTYGIPLSSAVKCAAVNPAKEIGIYNKYGSITPGKYANVILLDKNYHLKAVILKGKLIIGSHIK
jgi:N-acetylglucosamine-6-phosphate deacetylase